MKREGVLGIISVALLGYFGFARTRAPEPPPSARRALRPEAVGCYALLDAKLRRVDTAYYNASPVVRLDSALDTASLGASDSLRRQLRAFDALGAPSRTTRGMFPLGWSADSLSDSIRISFGNGLSGAEFVLALPAGATDTLHGRAEEDWDFGPPFATDRGRAHAARVR